MSENPFKEGDDVIIISTHLNNKHPQKVMKVIEDMVLVLDTYFYYTELRLATNAEKHQNRRIWK